MDESVSCPVLPLPVLISKKQIIVFQYSLQTEVQDGALAEMPELTFNQLIQVPISINAA